MYMFSKIKLFFYEFCLKYLPGYLSQRFSPFILSFSHRFLSLFLRFKRDIHNLEYSELKVGLVEDALDLPRTKLNKLNPTYALLRRLAFVPEVNINRVQDFKSLLKWNELILDFPVLMRNYPLGFSANIKRFDRPELALKLPPRVKAIDRKDFLIARDLITYEEIVTLLPYVRKGEKKKIYRIPVIKEPVVKYHFSREEIRLMREKVAQQNKTGWLSIEIYEVYDKFFPNLYHNIRQVPGTRALECYLSQVASTKNPKKNYYLIIGHRRDTGQSIKAIVDPADIKTNENS